MTFERQATTRPSGDGYAQLRQVMLGIMKELMDEGFVGLEYATANAPETITLDRDGYPIYAEEDDFVVLRGIQYVAGDRLIVATTGGPRGRVVVLGSWQISSTSLIEDAVGSSAIISGNTAVVVAHGLVKTPDFVAITPTGPGTVDYERWWVSSIDDINFTLNVSVDPDVAGFPFNWRASIFL